MTATITATEAAQSVGALRAPVALDDYQRGVARALTRVFDDETDEKEVELESARIVVFSDHHKGGRDGADDFRGCERAYAAALAYYVERGFTLVALGDAEELWECPPKEVVKAYREVLELEGEFHRVGRYERLWGNHDLQWSDRGEVSEYLESFFPRLRVREALKLRVVDNGDRLGLIFLAHGHQGTLDSDRWAWLSRPVVRHLWRPLQRRLDMRSTTPSRDFQLRRRHDEAMYSWARGHRAKPVLIAGHTHRPVFWTSRAPDKVSVGDLERQLEERRVSGTATTDELAEIRARLECARAELREKGPPPIVIDPPCYFNTGCCSFGDGDVTGIEIVEGEIRLVRWPDDDDEPARKALVTAALPEVLERVAGPGRAQGG